MSNQYFVTAALPAITLGERPEISFFDFITLVQDNLPKREMEAVRTIWRLIDLYNLAAFWRGEPIDRHGSLGPAELEEAISEQHSLPPYVVEFLERYQDNESRLANHGALIARFFREEIAKATGFLRVYLEFEREWRLMMVGFRAAYLGRDLSKELQWEDPTEPIIAGMLAQRDSKAFEPIEGFEGLKPIFHDYRDDPLQLHLALERYRFEHIQELIEAEMFSIDYVLGYMVQLMIAEKWQELHEQQYSSQSDHRA